jgi:PAS domain S-box-containing protein
MAHGCRQNRGSGQPHYRAAHDSILKAIETVLVEGPRTPDMGGTANTAEAGAAVAVARKSAFPVSHLVSATLEEEVDLIDAQRLAHLGSWHWDAKTDVTTGSHELLRIYGFDPATQTMPNFQEQRGCCYPVEDWEQVNAAVQRCLETGVGYQLDVRVIRNGALIWVTTRGEATRDVNGQMLCLRGTVQDITERKSTEEALRLTQESIDCAAEMVAWFTPDGSVYYVNDATCLALGYSRDVR